jgi:hypothetical protein
MTRIRVPLVVEAIPMVDLINETAAAFRTHPTESVRRPEVGTGARPRRTTRRTR